ncbi:hypothetical protein BLOT_013060 [Blomia tropicalis]|nr:hypothetical protein BLOT_013060 [Blomia tropicalis]
MVENVLDLEAISSIGPAWMNNSGHLGEARIEFPFPRRNATHSLIKTNLSKLILAKEHVGK